MNTTPAGSRPQGSPPRWNGQELLAAFAARRDRSWTQGYASLDQPTISGTAEWAGTFPSGLRGTLFRNGPAKHERGGRRYAHRWDGDGMVQRFTLTETGVAHHGRYVETAKYLAEESAGRMIFSGFGTAVDDMPPTPARIEASNPANISIIPFAREYWALWEAGAPYAIDPVTLSTLGSRSSVLNDQPAPFSAHPKLARDGTLWNFGVDPIDDVLHIYRISADGRSIGTQRLHVDHIAPIHDFAITERYLVFLLPAITCNRDRLMGGASFAESCQWSPQMGMRVLIVSQSDGSVIEGRLPAGCLFHVANAWEDKAQVVVDYMRSADPSSLLAGWSVMAGEYRHRRGAALTRARIALPDGSASQEALLNHDAEFPTVRASDTGKVYRHLLCLERTQSRPQDVPGYDQLAYIDAQTGDRRVHHFGDAWLAEEHLLVGEMENSAPRWAVGSGLDLNAKQTVLSVFDLRSLEAGPVAQARLPYALPLGLHGTFVPVVFP
ncbi:MAG: carotenoid oxygenase family protein [Burkholderiaceae bacterium]|nr:carotenoid oxygenase family protein [Burkholderiaceae bacterium]